MPLTDLHHSHQSRYVAPHVLIIPSELYFFLGYLYITFAFVERWLVCSGIRLVFEDVTHPEGIGVQRKVRGRTVFVRELE
jgi:hypothetical protein